MDTVPGGRFVINPRGGCEGFTFGWPAELSIAPTENMATELDPGSYTVTITDACGCSNVVEGTITGASPVVAMPLDVSPIVCAGQLSAIGIDPSSVSGGTGVGYRYSINKTPLIAIDSIAMVAPGQHTLVVFDSDGCASPDIEIFVDSEPPYSVDLGPEEIDIELGTDVITLNADIISNFPVDSIVWTSETPFECLNVICDSIQIFPTTSTTFAVEIIDINDCRTSTSIDINLDTPRRTYVPNFFIPGSSSIEDKVIIHTGRGVVRVENFIIYDRYGNIVFELPDDAKDHPTSRDNGWDGTINGRNAEQGVYVWIANVTFADEITLPMQGQITLIREN